MKKIILFSALALCLSSCLKNHIERYGVGINYISDSGQNFTYKIHYWINGLASEKIITVTPNMIYDTIDVQPNNKFCVNFPELNKSYIYIQESDIPISNYLFFSLIFDKNNKLIEAKTTELNAKKLIEVPSCETE